MDQVRFGVIGLGGMGSFHLGTFKDLQGAVLAAVCDIDQAKLQRYSKQYEVPGFDAYEKLLDSGAVDAVIIATPHYLHPPIAEAAFARGLHVLSEKPAGVLVKSVRQLNETYKKHADRLKFGIMFQMRTNPMYAKLREVIADGELGQLTRITWLVTNWFRPWAYYASGGWRATWSGEGGGVLLNQCPHNLDQIQWITGMMPSRITAVGAVGKTHPIEVEDEVSAILEYENGAIGHFVTSTGEAPGTNRLEVCGDRGKIVAEHGKLRFSRTRRSVQEVSRTVQEMFPNVETWDMDVPYGNRPEAHRTISQNFVNAILKDEPLMSPGIDGVRGLEIGAAMQMAALTRKAVDLPLDGDAQERFIQEMTRKYGGRKTLAQAEAKVDMAASFHT